MGCKTLPAVFGLKAAGSVLFFENLQQSFSALVPAVFFEKSGGGSRGRGDVIDVAQGYAENYLIPQKLAVAATKGNLKQLEERRNNIEKREAVRLADANALKAKLDGQKVAVDAKVGEEGVLFGSVTAAMIVDAIKAELDVEIDRKRVELGKPIKVAGSHEVEISIYREIKASIVVLVGVEEQAEETVEAEEVAAEETAEVETEAAAE